MGDGSDTQYRPVYSVTQCTLGARTIHILRRLRRASDAAADQVTPWPRSSATPTGCPSPACVTTPAVCTTVTPQTTRTSTRAMSEQTLRRRL